MSSFRKDYPEDEEAYLSRLEASDYIDYHRDEEDRVDFYESIEESIKRTKDRNLRMDIEQIIRDLKIILSGTNILDTQRLLKIFSDVPFYSEELLDIFMCSECIYDLGDNKEFMVGLMKATGDMTVIAEIILPQTIKEILQDEELIRQIITNEFETPGLLSGCEIIASFMNKLNGKKEVLEDKEFIKELLNRLLTFAKAGIVLGKIEQSFLEMIDYDCRDFFTDRDCIVAVLDFIEITEMCHGNVDAAYSLSSRLLCTEELANDMELAKRFFSIFNVLHGISEELLKDRAFLEKILNDTDESEIGDCFRLPSEFSTDITIIEKYLNRGGSFEGISLDFLKFQQSQGVTGLDYYIEEYQNYLLNSIFKMLKSGIIVTGLEDTPDSLAAIETLRQWAEDNDLIKIGYPFTIIRVLPGEIKGGFINIGVGDNRGTRLEREGTYEEMVQKWAEDNDLVKIGEKVDMINLLCNKVKIDVRDLDPVNTIVIDKNPECGIKSLCDALASLGLREPEHDVIASKETYSMEEVKQCVQGVVKVESLLGTMKTIIDTEDTRELEKGDEKNVDFTI